MDSPSFDEVLTYTITDLSNQPVRMVHPGPLPENWSPAPSGVWVVPEHALQWGYDHREHVYAGGTLVLPAEEQSMKEEE